MRWRGGETEEMERRFIGGPYICYGGPLGSEIREDTVNMIFLAATPKLACFGSKYIQMVFS